MVNDGKKDREANELILVATHRLLGGPSALTDIKGSGSLACLSVRFALDLDISDIYVALTQIEQHVRLCVAATAGFEKLIITNGLEPFLAEAAHQLMADSGADPAAGDRRWVSVDDLMRALLPVSAYEQLQRSKPRFWIKPFREAFESYHVIKDGPGDPDMINTVHPWKCFQPRRDGNKLSLRSVTAVLILSKSDKRFGFRIDEALFDMMESPLPVIPLVFALGSEHAGVLFPAVPERRDGGCDGGAFTAYDAWCAGLSPDMFRDIDSGGALASYRALRRRGLQPHEGRLPYVARAEDTYWEEAAATAREEQRRKIVAMSWQRAELSA
ncbi:hypothetical protein BJY52DRAFT_1192901 [Lactarius psammicola]|nr:hypothetical protein BJY52DRAFT_1192901 [Lactarius psammicola]